MTTLKKTAKKKTTKPSKRGAGGKLSRSEIVQTRLNPRLRFTAELMAKHQGRSLSSLIEQLIIDASKSYSLEVLSSNEAQTLHYMLGDRHEALLTAKAVTDRIWSPDPADRFAMTALYLPDLLTADECRVWRWLEETPYFWQHFLIYVENRDTGERVGTDVWRMVDQHSLQRDRLRHYWPQIEAVKEGQASMETLEALVFPELTDEEVLSEPPAHYPYPVRKIAAGYSQKMAREENQDEKKHPIK